MSARSSEGGAASPGPFARSSRWPPPARIETQWWKSSIDTPDLSGSASPRNSVEHLLVGEIGTAHGLQGEVSVKVLSEDQGRFAPGSLLLVGRDPHAARPLKVEGSRIHSGRTLVRFSGIEGRTAAESLRGLLVFVTSGELRVLESGAYWEHELAGARVVDVHGAELGVVSGVEERPEQDIWSVETQAGRVMLPAVKQIIISVDVEGRRIVVDPPEGLFPGPRSSPAGQRPARPGRRRLKFDVITIFPDWFASPLETGLLGKAIASGLMKIDIHDLRKWGVGPHRKVDDAPFGGGAGMVMAPGPVVDAVEAVRAPDGRVILLAAAGRPLSQSAVLDFSQERQLVLVCGRYEGMDDRIGPALGAEEWSIGEFVLSGGEIAALAVIEAVSRLVPGLMGNQASLHEESFSSGLLEYPQYTRPADFRGMPVPQVLLSGNHADIARWRREQALRRTMKNRPHILDQAALTDGERALLDRLLQSEQSPDDE